jgi:hypothetical protein
MKVSDSDCNFIDLSSIPYVFMFNRELPSALNRLY